MAVASTARCAAGVAAMRQSACWSVTPRAAYDQRQSPARLHGDRKYEEAPEEMLGRAAPGRVGPPRGRWRRRALCADDGPKMCSSDRRRRRPGEDQSPMYSWTAKYLSTPGPRPGCAGRRRSGEPPGAQHIRRRGKPRRGPRGQARRRSPRRGSGSRPQRSGQEPRAPRRRKVLTVAAASPRMSSRWGFSWFQPGR